MRTASVKQGAHAPPTRAGPTDPALRWFGLRGWTPWEFQREAWAAYSDGRSGLIQVATGAGKTYAAYMGPLAELIRENTERGAAEGLRVLYITPLKAVARDIEAALRAPVAELGAAVTVESRTGDTSTSVRARQKSRLPNVLVTTPESLTLLMTQEDAGARLGSCRAVIVDEWHELMAGKRGTQTELALARLRRFAPGVRTWALSATLPNAEEAARAACGMGTAPRIIRGETSRRVVIDTVLPSAGRSLPLAGHLGLFMLPEVVGALDPGVPSIIFTNTRSQAERWYHALLVARPEWAAVTALHHGSLDRDERERVEGGLKRGQVRLVVSTSSLDLGVDFDPIERVFQIGSPKGVARLVQRAGRASHRPRAACRVTCVPAHALELIEIAAAREAVELGDLEPRATVDKPLDVLTQHLVTCALGGGFEPDAMFEEVRTAWSYRGLTREEFDWALALVTRGGKSLAAYPDYHRVAVEGARHTVTSRRVAQLHRLNVGTITAGTTVDIRYLGGRSLGRIEEDFIAGLREGQKFVFAGKVLRFEMFRDMVAYVRPAAGTTNYTPIWYGTKLPISESLAQAIRRTFQEAGGGRADCPELAAAAGIIGIQRRESIIPGAEEVLAEITQTAEGSHLFLFPFEGRLVHAGVAGIVALRLSRLRPATFSIAANDYGLEILSAEPFPFEELLTPGLFSADALTQDAMESANSSLLARLAFREIARIAGLVVQTYPGKPKTGKQVQASASLIFDVLREFEPDSLLLEQARREVLERHYEQGRLGRAFARMGGGGLRIVRTRRPTPLSFPLLIERLAGRLSSESILERIERMQRDWAAGWTREDSKSGSVGTEPAPPARRGRRSPWKRPPGPRASS